MDSPEQFLCPDIVQDKTFDGFERTCPVLT